MLFDTETRTCIIISNKSLWSIIQLFVCGQIIEKIIAVENFVNSSVDFTLFV